MIRTKLFLCAEHVIRDAETQQASIIGIIEEITPFGLPLMISKLCTFALLQKDSQDPDEYEVEISHAINQRELFRQKIAIKFQGVPITRFAFTMGGLLLDAPGILDIKLEQNGNTIGSYSILIKAPPTVQGETRKI